jgi:pimeloyl-ACP methyl ester carboxylesterase
VVLLGISFGTGVALQAGALDRAVEAVVALSTYRTGEEWLRDMRPLHQMAALLERVDAARRAGGDGADTRLAVSEVFPRDPIGAANDEELRRAGSDRAAELDVTSVEQILRFRPVDHASTLRSTPTLLLHCEADVTMWRNHARELAIQAGATFEVLRGVDHYSVYQPANLGSACDRISQYLQGLR